MDPRNQRAPTIPPEAIFDADSGNWELCERDALGRRHGTCRRFRGDGSLHEVCAYQSGVREGAFSVYHPDGRVARRGAFASGVLHGDLAAFASDTPTAEPLAGCCVPAGAWELRARYARGRPLREVFFDREGRALLSNGDPQPDRPVEVPGEATFDEGAQRWVHGTLDADGRRQGLVRSWSGDGALVEEATFHDDAPTRTRIFDGAGRLVEDVALAGERIRHGDFFRQLDATDNPYADPRIRTERGGFDRDRPVGVWALGDGAGAVVTTIDLGLPLDEDRVDESPAFARRAPGEPAASGREGDRGWSAVVARLVGERRIREAICAAARGAVASGDTTHLSNLLARSTLPLAPAARAERAAVLAESSVETLTSALDALVGGGDAATALRTLAAVLDSDHPAALDFINASLLLDPRPRKSYLTRALVRIEHGDDLGARADQEIVARESPDEAHALAAHLRLHFPTYTFWPANEPLATPARSEADDGEPDREFGGEGNHESDGERDAADADAGSEIASPVQPLPAVHRQIRVYATRLLQLRNAVRDRIDDGPLSPEPLWLPPSLAVLLPDGPVRLRHFRSPAVLTLDVAPEAGAGAPADTPPDVDTDIEIDETVPRELLDQGSVAALLAVARATWSALAWLCWSCGLDRVAWPDAIAPPPTFAAAVALSVARCFRAHDRMLTGGARGAAQGLPGFTWEGLDIDDVPIQVARFAAAEYLEMRSMFLWLCLPDAVSPFQSDLREA